MQLTVLSLLADRGEGEFDLFEALLRTLEKNHKRLKEGDILVISTKYVAGSQGRVIDLKKTRISGKGFSVGRRFHLRPEIAEVVIRESDKVLGGIGGFVITSLDDIIAPNAGIDKSNAREEKVILYPTDPYLVAEQMRRRIFLEFLIHVGVILADSRLMPTRVGTSGVAIGCAGIEPVLDMRAKKDLYGNPLKVTFQATVDNLATIANHKMGEGAESRPYTIVRNSGATLTNRRIRPSEVAVSPDQCVYVRGLSNPPREG